MRINRLIAIISAASLLPTVTLISGGSAADALAAAGELTRSAAYFSAGVPITAQTAAVQTAVQNSPDEPAADNEKPAVTTPTATAPPAQTTTTQPAQTTQYTTAKANEDEPPAQSPARVITQNITPFDDELDYTSEGQYSGAIQRKTYKATEGSQYITLASGAAVQNCTEDSNEVLLAAASELPPLQIEFDTPDPQVLIVHTHATESFEPYQRSYFDEDFPSRTQDPSHNMIAVGDVLAQTLANNGISVVHDGTLHDYPAYTGSYDRSEETIRATLKEYPSIKIVIDLHRDAIADADGTRIAPAAQIDSKSAAQFMIIAGCDDGRFNMPNYMENFKLAALLQNTAEEMYPGLARPVLFDYRNYNQHITTGSLLIEVGSHANSLDEALYTAELLGNSMACALWELS